MTQPIFSAYDSMRIGQSAAAAPEVIQSEMDLAYSESRESHKFISFAPGLNTEPEPVRSPDIKNTDNTAHYNLAIVMKDLERFQSRLNEIVSVTASQRVFKVQELLALQAEVHQIIQQIELVSKIIEQATSGIKTTLQTQV
jgi:hypothetical protein